MVSLGKSCTHPRRHRKYDSRMCPAWRAGASPGAQRSQPRCTPYHQQQQSLSVIPIGRGLPTPNPRSISSPLWDAPIQPGMTLDSSVGFCRTWTNQGSQLLYCEEVHCIAGHAPKPGLLLHQSLHVPPRGRGRPLVPLECLKLACLRQAESDETTPRSSKGS